MATVVEALIASRDRALLERLEPLMQGLGCAVEFATSTSHLRKGPRGSAVVLLDSSISPDWAKALEQMVAQQHGRNRVVFWLADSQQQLAKALHLGADEAMLKGGGDLEFSARLSALLRRIGQAYPSSQLTVSLGLTLDRALRRVTYMGQSIPLTHREFELLAFLMSHPDRLFSREELIQGAWPKYSSTHRTLDQFVTQVRAKLTQYSVERPHIATVWGQGYCLSTGQCPCDQTAVNKPAH